MATDKKGFVLYADQINLFELLTDAEAGLLIKHIFNYVNDKNPSIENKIVNLAFTPIKQQLKRDLIKWEQFREKQSLNGKLGGRPKKPKPLIENPSLLEKSQKSLTDKVKVTVNVKDKVKDIFKNKLLSFGFDEILVDDWLKVRKAKKASNTETAYNGFIKQVELTGMDKNEVLKICVERSWSGLKADWIEKPKLGKIETLLKSHEIAKANL